MSAPTTSLAERFRARLEAELLEAEQALADYATAERAKADNPAEHQRRPLATRMEDSYGGLLSEGWRGRVEATEASHPGFQHDPLVSFLMEGWPEGLGNPLQVEEALAVLRSEADAIVSATLEDVSALAATFVPEDVRTAVLDVPELVQLWAWPVWSLPVRTALCLDAIGSALSGVVRAPPRKGLGTDKPMRVTGVAKFLGQPRMDVPPAVAFLEVLKWAREPLARLSLEGPEVVENVVALGSPFVGGVSNAVRIFALRDETGTSPRIASPWSLGVLYLARDKVEEGRARRVVPFSASSLSRAAVQVITAGPRAPGREGVTREPGRLVLHWKGGKDAKPVQLALQWEEPGQAALAGILHELQEDGARDWLLVHRMAADQGRSGDFAWTWPEHMERSLYAKRIRQKNRSEEELHRGVTRNLRWLAWAELREFAPVTVNRRGKKEPGTAWRRVGPHGLIDIPAGVDTFNGLEAARMRLNAEIYEGAAKGGNCFALVCEDALMLDGAALRLAAMLAFARWYERDKDGGTLIRTARNLWEAATLRGGEPAPKYRQRAGEDLEHTLDRLGKAGELSSWDRLDPGPVSPETRYRILPPHWWVVQAVHRVTPLLPPTTTSLPRNGTELRAWREARGLSQRELAEKLGAGQKTLSRVEATGAKALPARLLELLRALLAGNGV